MHPQTTKCFAVVVHFGSSAPTDQLVTALANNSPSPFRIIVIDHAQEPYQSPLPQTGSIQVIRPAHNEGYGAGVVLGLGAALQASNQPETDIVLVLNNDTSVQLDTIQQLLAWWQQQPGNIIGGLRLGRVNFLTGRAVLPLASPPLIRGGWEGLGVTQPYLHGAALVGSITNLARLPIPTDYFMYAEDVAASFRAARKNITLAAIPAATGIKHDDSQQREAPQKIYYLVRNGARVLQEEAPLFWRLWWRIVNRLREPYHQLLGHQLIALALRHARKGIRSKYNVGN